MCDENVDELILRNFQKPAGTNGKERKGQEKKEKEEKEENYHRMERSYGYFNRTIELPSEVDPEKVDASYKKGVLKIELKKTKESETKKIEIKS